MEALKLEMARKRAAAEAVRKTAGTGPSNKYVRQGDILQEQEKQKVLTQLKLDEVAKGKAKAKAKAKAHTPNRGSVIACACASASEASSAEAEEAVAPVSVSVSVSCKRDADALADAPVDGSNGEKKYEGADESEAPSHKRKRKERAPYQPAPDGSLYRTQYSQQKLWSPEKIVLNFLEMLLQAWAWDLCQRSSSSSQSSRGKQDTAALEQIEEHIQPLFRLCKRREVPSDILGQLAAIVLNCEQGDFKTANDHYLQAAIGNAPWPIGLTMVGIHERSGREKISTGKVAHVMNNEQQRKYFTSVKRLMGFAQRKRTDVAPSMKVL